MTWVELPALIWMAVLSIIVVVALACLHTAASQVAFARDVRQLRREAEALRIEYQRRLQKLRGEQSGHIEGNAAASTGVDGAGATGQVDVIGDDEIVEVEPIGVPVAEAA